MFKKILYAVPILVLTGCQTTNEENDNEQIVSTEKVHCVERARLGSSIKRLTCITNERKEQRDEDAFNTRRILREAYPANIWDPRRPNPNSIGSGSNNGG